jgi:hypothetical protein
MGLLGFLSGKSKKEQELEEKIAKLEAERVARLEKEVEHLKQKEVKKVEEAHTEEFRHLDNHHHNSESGLRRNNNWPPEVMLRAVNLDGGMEGGRKKGLPAEDSIRQAVDEWNEKVPMSKAIIWREGYAKHAASTLHRFRKELKKLGYR